MAQHAVREIFSQPEVWKIAEKSAGECAGILPRKGERVAFVGCGTSWFMSMAGAARREELGQGESDAFTASEFPTGRRYDRIVAISRSGTTTEVLELLEKLDKSRTVAITAVAGSPVTNLAGSSIVLDFADETSVLQTRYATAVLTLLRTHFGENIASCISEAKNFLSCAVSPHLLNADQITFLGTKWTIGLAHEAALKARESAQFWAEAYPAMDYRHGPISVAQHGRVVWIFGAPPAGLVADIRRTGASIEVSECDPMAHLLLAQRVAIGIAQSRGLDADNPRALSRSVVLR